MVNSITILASRRRNLVEQKTRLKREYENSVRDIDNEISHIDTALKTIEKAAEPYKCKACNGTGQRTKADAAGGREEVTCEKCHGTGFDLSKS